MNESEVNELIRQRLVHEIHTSGRKSFRGCRRRWSWIFNDYYYPTVTAKPLEFGVAFHNAMETFYHPDTWKFDRQIVLNSAIQVFVDTCREQEEKYLAIKEANALDDSDEEDYDERVELGKKMLQYFAEKVSPEWDAHWTPRHVEIEFIVPIQNPDDGEYLFCRCKDCWRKQKEADPERYGRSSHNDGMNTWKGLPVTFAGRIDALMEDKHGGLWVTDWKTAATISIERGDSFLTLDDQVGSYVMALRRKLGIDVRGFLYVELRKAVPEPPKENAARRLGRLFSVSKNQATDYDTYLTHVAKYDTAAYEEGLYDDFLTFLKEEGSIFNYRWQIHKTDEELEQIERTLYHEAADMVDPNLRIYPNPGRFNCGYCAFQQPCIEMNRQGDYQFLLDESGLYDKRKEHYWVKQLSTDKRGNE